jgi:CheY-like chemotaxis protein
MNFGNILPHFYRIRFREYLKKAARRRARQQNKEESRRLVFADLFLSGDLAESEEFPEPNEAGEINYGTIANEEAEFHAESQDIIPAPEAQDIDWKSISAYKSAFSKSTGPIISRRAKLEDEIRRIKALSQPCPCRNERGICAVPFIRCGDRYQFAVRESVRQQSKPHPCLYQPGSEGDYVIIVDNDACASESVRKTLELHCNIEEKKIISIDSAENAVGILNRFKQENRRAALLIIDEDMPNMSGYKLVNEIYARNHNARVILMHDPAASVQKPRDYAGDIYITPRKRVVHVSLAKPVHCDILIKTMSEVYPRKSGRF